MQESAEQMDLRTVFTKGSTILMNGPSLTAPGAIKAGIHNSRTGYGAFQRQRCHRYGDGYPSERTTGTVYRLSFPVGSGPDRHSAILPCWLTGHGLQVDIVLLSTKQSLSLQKHRLNPMK